MENTVFVIRNYRGLEEINYLLSLDDFKKRFVGKETRTDLFSVHDPDEDWKLFIKELKTIGFADWYLSNNDSFVVYLCNNDNLEGFLRGKYNEDPIEMIKNNRNPGESIVDTIEQYTECCVWRLDLEESTPEVVNWAKGLFPALVTSESHGMTFGEAVNELKNDMCFDELKACEDHIAELAAANSKRLTTWNGAKWILPQGPGSWRQIAERLAAYENTELEPDEIEALKRPTVEMLSNTELERAFRIRDHEYMREDAQNILEGHEFPEEKITDDLLDRMVDLFENYESMDDSALTTWNCVLSTILTVDCEDVIRAAYESLKSGHCEELSGIIEQLEEVCQNCHLIYPKKNKLREAIETLKRGMIDDAVAFLGKICG